MFTQDMTERELAEWHAEMAEEAARFLLEEVAAREAEEAAEAAADAEYDAWKNA